MKAPDIMTEQVRTVRADEPVAVALELLAAAEARHLPVVNARGELEGILSDRDLRGLLGRYDEDPERFAEAWNAASMRVGAVMTADPITVDPQADVEDIVGLFVEEKIGALPVVDTDRRVLGIITYIDVLRAWQREHEAIGVPVILPTTAALEDRALAGRGERRGVPLGMARRGGREARARGSRGRGEEGSRGARITIGAKKVTSKKAAPKSAPPKKVTPKKAAPKRAAPKRAAPKRAAPKRAAPARAR